jgi:hypothetical protein
MSRKFIRYKSKYKYQLVEKYEVIIPIVQPDDIKTKFINLDPAGNLTVKNSYAWDGPSGPVIDTHENMRASLVHDALYQLMRMEKLSARTHRKTADKLFRDMCKKDGVSNFRASVYYKALRKFGKPSASPENKKEIYRAPRGS